MRSLNEISWGGRKYPSPKQVATRTPQSEPSLGMEEEGLEFPGERYEPPFNYVEIVARGSGKPWDNVIKHLRDMERELKHAEVDIVSLVADSGLDDDADMKYSFHITFQGFTGYYSWTHQWIGFDAEGQDAYGQGLSNLMQLRIDHSPFA